jgi:pyruvate decarboxylase
MRKCLVAIWVRQCFAQGADCSVRRFYNKLPDWDYSKLAQAFGPGYPSKYYGPISTPQGLDELVADEGFGAARCFQLVELKLGRLDAPLPLRMATAAVEAFNQQSKQGIKGHL